MALALYGEVFVSISLKIHVIRGAFVFCTSVILVFTSFRISNSSMLALASSFVILTLSSLRLTGARSPWHGYLLSLPEKTNIALLWHDAVEDDREALIWIKGTMAERERFEGAFREAQGSGKFVSVSLASC